MIVLAADVGGTNARLATVDIEAPTARIVRLEKYRSHDYPGLAPIVRRFREETGCRADRACFGVACPVVGDDCTAPNLPWTINARALAAEIGIPRTTIINDFVAVGYGIETVVPGDLTTLQEGTAVPNAPIALIGPGTGLGQGFLIWERDHYRVLASEGGHTDFAPVGDLQVGLLRFLSGEFGHVSWERVLSGRGIENIYRYLAAAKVASEQPSVPGELARDDPASVITRHALDGTDCLSVRAVDLFCEILGAQAGNLALTIVATGGVYLAGGIAPRLASRLASGPFMEAFRNKGRLSELLARVPVYIVMNSNAALLGAAAVAGRLV